MAFSVSEMLEMPGHDDVPDHVTIEYIHQTQYNGSRSTDPSFSYATYDPASDDSHPSPSVRRSQSSREVHGRPVPGDRDFRRSDQRIDNHVGGLDPLFLSEHFAPERFEEMMKMLRIMMSTHEKKFGSRNARDRLKQDLGVLGLEDEHKQYVEKLEDEWRTVGKILRCKPKEKYCESAECSVSDGTNHLESASCYSSAIVGVDGPASSSKHNMPVGLGSFDEEHYSAHVHLEKVKDVVEDEHVGRRRGSANAKGKVPVQPDDYVQGKDDSSQSIMPERIDDDDRSRRLTATADTNSSNPGPESRIPPGGPDEGFWREAESSNAHDGVDILEKLIYNETVSPGSLKPEHGFASTTGGATSLASDDMYSERNTRGLDAEEMRVRETPAIGFRHMNPEFNTPQSLIIPTDPENPLESSSHLRTPDRRNSDPSSPFKDFSSIPQGNEQRRLQHRLPDEARRPQQNPWVSGLKTPEKSPKRVSSFNLRRRHDLKGNQFSSNVSEDIPDLRIVPKPKVPRPPSTDMRLTTPRGKTVSDDPKASGEASTGGSESSNPLDIPPLSTGLAPIRVASTDKDCGVSEPTHRSCAVCAARRAAAGTGERSPVSKSGNRSPYSPHHPQSGRNIFGAPDASLKQSTMRKSSGIYTPLTVTKKSNVVLKTNSSRPYSNDLTDSDKNFRRQSSMRSSEESPRSTDVQGTSNDSKSGLEESITLTRSSTTWNERSQISKEKLTPGGPRRGGKVDRVARFAEMQNFWKSDKFLNASGKRKSQSFYRIFSKLHESHERFYAAYRERCETTEAKKEMVTRLLSKLVPDGARSKNEQPPFVVPLLHSSSERIRSPRAFL